MNILDTIIKSKKAEIAKRRLVTGIAELERQEFFCRKTLSLKTFLRDETKSGIIAEFKRRSPSKGMINTEADAAAVTRAYTNYGASCLSVLTDGDFFGGSTEDLLAARVNKIPVLRKDFIIDEYQLTESKAMGADVVLLIAACLTPERVMQLAGFAKQLELEVLLEIHNEAELQHICDEIELVGVNNRDLKTFEVDIERSAELGNKIPAGKLRIAESGIRDTATIKFLKESGFTGFLMGERFMKENDPGEAFRLFVESLKY